MRLKASYYGWVFLILVIQILVFSSLSFAEKISVDFDPEHWNLDRAQLTKRLGQNCIIGQAFLKDVEFINGIIEVDMAVTYDRRYPAIVFRRQSETNYENFYIRPHVTKYIADALQYTPVFNGIAGWQLYNGDGFTSTVEIPYDRWFHVKIEIHETRARVFLDDMDTPALIIDDLKHGVSKGSIGVSGPPDTTACFSNFSYEITNDLDFGPSLERLKPLGVITDYEISQSFLARELSLELPLSQQDLPEIEWQQVQADESGLLDIARFVKWGGGEAEAVWVKATIYSDSDQSRELSFGYSDVVSIFLNDQILFSGNSSYRSRSESFGGIIGLNDYVFLPLKKGNNELLFLLVETFGGWGLICRDADIEYQHKSISKLWEHQKEMKYPESAIYDEMRDVLYVTHYFNHGGDEFISKVKPSGEIEELEWIKGLILPLGICQYNDLLYVVERRAMAEIDIDSREIINRYRFPQPIFPNDIAIDSSGHFYVTDGQKDVIYRMADSTFEVWLDGPEVKDPNGIFVTQDNRLIYGNSGDCSFKVVDQESKSVTTIAAFEKGSVMDGIREDGRGNLILGDYNGRIFSVSPDGKKTLILDISATGLGCADIEFIPGKNLLIVPSLFGNRLTAYKYIPADY